MLLGESGPGQRDTLAGDGDSGERARRKPLNRLEEHLSYAGSPLASVCRGNASVCRPLPAQNRDILHRDLI